MHAGAICKGIVVTRAGGEKVRISSNLRRVMSASAEGRWLSAWRLGLEEWLYWIPEYSGATGMCFLRSFSKRRTCFRTVFLSGHSRPPGMHSYRRILLPLSEYCCLAKLSIFTCPWQIEAIQAKNLAAAVERSLTPSLQYPALVNFCWYMFPRWIGVLLLPLVVCSLGRRSGNLWLVSFGSRMSQKSARSDGSTSKRP